MFKQSITTITVVFVLSISIFLLSCEKAPITETWIGTYAFPTDESPDFPLYMTLIIQDDVVTGQAIDGNMEKATISGNIEAGFYSLLIHPLKHGSKTNQDVTYQGQRLGNTIEGEWVHVVGAKGPWKANITTKSVSEEIPSYRLPCMQANQSENLTCEPDA